MKMAIFGSKCDKLFNFDRSFASLHEPDAYRIKPSAVAIDNGLFVSHSITFSFS